LSGYRPSEAHEQWDEYVESYCRWAEQWEHVLLQNRQKVEAWQAEHDAPYLVYRLFYAVVPSDWSASGKSERASIWSLTPTPDKDGYWTVIEKGRAVNRRFHMWISIDAGIRVLPSEERFGYVLFLPNAQLNVCVHPSRTWTAQELEKELALTPLPREPEQLWQIYSELFPELKDDLDYAAPRHWALREYNRRRQERGLEPFDPHDYGVRNRTHESWEGLEDEEE
jgi:hypothetical protein